MIAIISSHITCWCPGLHVSDKNKTDVFMFVEYCKAGDVHTTGNSRVQTAVFWRVFIKLKLSTLIFSSTTVTMAVFAAMY